MAELLKLLQTHESSRPGLVENLLSQSSGSPSSSSPIPIASTSPLGSNLNVANMNKSPRSTSPTIQPRGSPNINMARRGNSSTTITTPTATTGSRDTAPTGGDINFNTSGAGSEDAIDTTGNRNRNLNTGTAVSPGSLTQGVDMDNFRRESEHPFHVDPNANCLSDVNQVLAKTKESPTERRRLLIAQVTDLTTEAHMASTLNTQANIREANERIARKQGGSPQQMPDMSKMSLEPSMMWQHFLNSMVPEMTKVVTFAKHLPGFSELDVEDQVRLIRQGMFEVMVARITLLVDNVNDTMLDPSLKMKQPRAKVRQMSPLGPFIDQFFDVARATNSLGLTDGENGLFGAILLLCPDRDGLNNVTAVRTIQQLYLQALYLLMKSNHKDADELFSSLISAIPSIRKVNDDHFRFLNNIKKKSASEFEAHFPQLHRELFDTTYQAVAH